MSFSLLVSGFVTLNAIASSLVTENKTRAVSTAYEYFTVMATTRIHAFDWLRGLAVLVMIQTHSLVLLLPATHADPLYRFLVRIDGLVAPAFIFTAGFALALVQCRAALRPENRRTQALRSLGRIGEVLLVATLVNFAWFPLFKEPKWLLRIDILHCIGLSLLLLLAVLVGLASRPRMLRWVLLGLASLLFGLAPFFETTPGLLGLFLNNQPGYLDPQTATVFPLLPWAGYAFLGASTGATLSVMQAERELWEWLGLLAALGVFLWGFQDAFNLAYPPHHFWETNPSNAGQRWALVVGLVAALRLVETRWPGSKAWASVKLLATFGASSLSAYVIHEMLLYHHRLGFFTRLWREQCDWPLYALVLTGLVTLTWLCVRGWDLLRPHLRERFTAWAKSRRAAS